MSALFEIANRLDGRPPTVHEGSPDGPPLQVVVYTGVPRKGDPVEDDNA
jgi:hypothetical protein